MTDEDCRFPGKHARGVFTRFNHHHLVCQHRRVIIDWGRPRIQILFTCRVERHESSVCEELIAQASAYWSAYLRQWQYLFSKVAMSSWVDEIKFVEMMVIEPGEEPTYMITWKTTTFLSHIQPRSHEDRFPIPLWETWFCQILGVPIPVLIENPRQCPCRQFSFDHYGDHIQTCQRQSATLPAYEWIVFKLSLLLRSVGHRVKPIK